MSQYAVNPSSHDKEQGVNPPSKTYEKLTQEHEAAGARLADMYKVLAQEHPGNKLAAEMAQQAHRLMPFRLESADQDFISLMGEELQNQGNQAPSDQDLPSLTDEELQNQENQAPADQDLTSLTDERLRDKMNEHNNNAPAGCAEWQRMDQALQHELARRANPYDPLTANHGFWEA